MKADDINKHRYDDIINLPRHISRKYPPMSINNRAAQFSAFAALVGYEDAVKETARLTDSKIELEDEKKYILSEKLSIIQERLLDRPKITITYFDQDKNKSGGKYITKTGVVNKIDEYNCVVIMEDKTKIYIDDIYEIDSDIFFENT